MINLPQGQPAPQTREELAALGRRRRADEAARVLLEIRSAFAVGVGMEASEQNIALAVQIYCAILTAEARS